MNRPELEPIAAQAREFLELQDEHREQALEFSRQVTRTAASIIKHAHRDEVREAEALLAEMAQAVSGMNERLQACPALWFAGFVTDALKEYAEAHQTLALVQGRALPTPDDIGVSPATYLNGLAEAIGEMRRRVLDLIRMNRPTEAEAMLDEMDELYALLMTYDYPEAVTLGLRRRTDAARGLVERTRGDVTNALQQARLEQRMAELRGRMAET